MDLVIELVSEPTTLIWWVFLAVVWHLHRRLVGFTRINTFTLFLPYLMLTNGILVPISNRLAYEIVGIDLTLTMYGTYWTSLALMYISLLLGILLANRLAPPRGEVEQDYSDISKLTHFAEVKVYLWIVAIISIVSILQIYAKNAQFDIISYVTMRMDLDAYNAHRYETQLSGWQFALYNKLPYGIAPLGIILVWNAKQFSSRVRWAFIGVLLFAVVQTGHKMPVIYVFAFMIMSRSLIEKRLVLTTRTKLIGLAGVAAVVFGLLPAFYLMQGHAGGYGDNLVWSIWRVFLEQARVLQLHFEVYPNIHPFLYGASTNTVATLLDVPHYVPPSVYIPTEVFGSENTSYPALFIGEGWADFGYAGVFATSVIAGFILQTYNLWFYRKQKPSLEQTALFLSVVFGSYHLMECNLFTTFFTYGLLSSAFIYAAIVHKSRAAT